MRKTGFGMRFLAFGMQNVEKFTPSVCGFYPFGMRENTEKTERYGILKIAKISEKAKKMVFSH